MVEPNIPLIPVTVPSAKARATTEIPMKMPPTKHSAGEKVVREGSPIPPENVELIFVADQGTAVCRVAPRFEGSNRRGGGDAGMGGRPLPLTSRFQQPFHVPFSTTFVWVK